MGTIGPSQAKNVNGQFFDFLKTPIFVFPHYLLKYLPGALHIFGIYEVLQYKSNTIGEIKNQGKFGG